MRFEKYQSGRDGQWYVRIVGDNGETLFRSTDGYRRERDADHAIELVQNDAQTASITMGGE